MKTVRVEGRNAVLELLRRGAVREIRLDAGAAGQGRLARILELAQKQGVAVRRVDRAALDKASDTGTHMGVIATAEAPPLATRVEEVIEGALDRSEYPFLLLLDDVRHKQNLGAILRTANAAGVHGIVLAGSRRSPLAPEVVRVSMGAAFFTPVIQESMFTALKAIRDAGISVIGADMSGDCAHFEADLSRATAICVGGESKGLSEPIRKRCDRVVRIPMFGMVSSLNVSVACAVLLYEKLRQDGRTGEGE